MEEAFRADGHQFYKVTVETRYAFGKFGGDKGRKYGLKWNGSDEGSVLI